ncbi:MAG: tetratricopeptide repeat protein, partial [Deltaproteobacteria bacterium]|nr:tetratricopeptide repeat protein [Deltaproteobacteria bacterium]
MDLELQHLLALGAAAAAGVVLLGALQRRRQSADAAQAYLKGFRYVLSDEPDQAIAELTRAAQDARTLEAYFALGALFRRTGEHERAIRLHQNMLLKPDLEARLGQQIQLELALDYQRAGMHARALEAYQKVLEAAPSQKEALAHLCELHEDRQDWSQAAQAHGRLVALGEGSAGVLAHLLAEAALVEPDLDRAQAFAARAVEVDPASAHAAMALGLSYLRQKRLAEAEAALERACEQAPDLSVRVAEALSQAAGAARAAAFFEARLAASEHAAPRLALAGRLRQAGRNDEALAHLRRALELDPR